MKLHINRFKSTLAVLVLSPLVGFAKPVLVAYMDQDSDFGAYSLAIVYSVWLSYVLNSGIYEGLLRFYTRLSEKRKPRAIKSFDIQVKSFWLVILSFALALVTLLSIFADYYYGAAVVLLALSHVSFNIYSASLRVRGDTFQIYVVQLLRW